MKEENNQTCESVQLNQCKMECKCKKWYKSKCAWMCMGLFILIALPPLGILSLTILGIVLGMIGVFFGLIFGVLGMGISFIFSLFNGAGYYKVEENLIGNTKVLKFYTNGLSGFQNSLPNIPTSALIFLAIIAGLGYKIWQMKKELQANKHSNNQNEVLPRRIENESDK